MTPGLSKDILSHVWLYFFYKQVQISRSDIRSHIKWAVSLVILHMVTSISLWGLCGYIWVNILTLSPQREPWDCKVWIDLPLSLSFSFACFLFLFLLCAAFEHVIELFVGHLSQWFCLFRILPLFPLSLTLSFSWNARFFGRGRFPAPPLVRWVFWIIRITRVPWAHLRIQYTRWLRA